MSELAIRDEHFDVGLQALSPPELAEIANREHALARQSGESLVEHALRAGDALIEAKSQVQHGEWLPWLAANFQASEWTAQAYMRLAANPRRVTDLEEPSLRKALKAIGSGDMDVHYSSDTDEWSTPQNLFDLLAAEFPFTLDVCATADNAKCDLFFSPEDDGLAQEWTGICWMNPPYGSVIGDWVRKAWESAKRGATIVCLLPARVDTGWWWEFARHGEVRFLRGRLRFGGGDTGAPFPSAVVVFSPEHLHEPDDTLWWEAWR